MASTCKHLVVVYLLLFASVAADTSCPSNNGETVESVCAFACNCTCHSNEVEFAACKAYCAATIETGTLCLDLVGPIPGAGGNSCPLASYNRDAVCSKLCACCGVPPSSCSCKSEPQTFLIRAVCDPCIALQNCPSI